MLEVAADEVTKPTELDEHADGLLVVVELARTNFVHVLPEQVDTKMLADYAGFADDDGSEKLGALVVTHDDSDHCKGISALLKVDPNKVGLDDNNGVGVRYKPGASGSVRHSIVWSNSGGLFLNGSSNATNNILQSVAGGSHSGTINSNPQFVTIWRGDYRLASTSPAVDTATSGILHDLDRVIRPQGAANDLGAFEHY